ncbi:MAG: thioredoxin family protein [Candidatus Diapherotrites archaeon CG10_big_fil_rev_8_21_14_0_10_31_34]|nr:MAG: thioredoxin family protein [Candidatus Diapherotrites archaeon CG10_big_fil_rev_8_21_14_0_10_31_34]PJA20818.1 MAG: thioredoxin family protein [Candidatus Diapherotrites archaeon CG_4_10_14_0_2_um_filter_31_5]
MKIQILGTGCPKCKQLEANVKKALEETGKKAEIEKVTDINKIIELGVMATPALVIDGKIVCSGRIPLTKEIKKWL